MTKKILTFGALLAALTFANTKANAQAVSGTVAVNLIL
jgi:hypothetical protein